jgi:tRNA (guanosine-2'-O-)-methyltransferase
MTPQRLARLRALLDHRQPDLTVLMENVHKPHNFSAILRTCDAVGVFEARAVAPAGRLRRYPTTSGGSHKWVHTRFSPTLGEALGELRASLRPFGEVQLLAAHQHERSIDYRAADYTRPTCILLGQEKDGVSAEAAAAADAFIVIPMHGMVASLNVSVATAVVLYEAERQRAAAGLYAQPRMESQLYQRTLFEWAYPDVAAYCRRLKLPYPRLDDDGELIDPVP